MLLVFFISVVLILCCVAIHYEILHRFAKIADFLKIKGRFKVAAGILWALIGHTVEIWLFGISYFVLAEKTDINNLVKITGGEANGFMDAIYFSFISYTSLGYGDIMPAGPMRFMAGLEALTGLVFIAWTASFLYLKMEQYWDNR